VKDAIVGTMDIAFNTRQDKDEKGKPRAGVTDRYAINLTVNKTQNFNGSISRQPNLYGGGIIGTGLTQAALYKFDLNLSLSNPANPSEKKSLGKWVGWMPIDEKSGVFKLDGARNADPEKDHGLRMAIDPVGTIEGFTENFDGKLYGKAAEKTSLKETIIRRTIGSKEVTVTIKRSDPMRFENMVLAAGPIRGQSPRTTVNGTLNYDYETGNYIADNIRFNYTFNGQPVEDVVTGTIKWIEDPQRKSNGKGKYEFNIRFNEAKNKPAQGESAAFAKMTDEEAFFSSDNTVPGITGTIEYVDSMSGDSVTSSKVTYKLDANKLTKQQVMNFAKLWLVCVGPTNDE
jgi:hypothetical protein